mmetsp:Transcript_63594/g.129575  ORF Transcript_63594/g.129575 Transcript_63594/m.129575 type:complete len:295 (+) Transcript_63594:170-1054(+)
MTASVNEIINDISRWIDNTTGVSGSFGYILIIILVVIGHKVMNRSSEPAVDSTPADEEEEKEPPRNFTMKQLGYFNGEKDERTEEDKPVYLALNGTVFDVSDGRNFYGPDGPYATFAGKECGVALAKMSFDAEHLDNLAGCKDLSYGEKDELDNWIYKFTYHRNYPVKGRLVPDEYLKSLVDRTLTKDDLSKHKGDAEEIPEGYATAPIYIGAGNKVFDASFGGVEFYGPLGGYNKFAGNDISRALAKMSFNPDDLANSDIDDLNDKQKNVLSDWIKTFEEKKSYPIVGNLGKE